MDQRQLNWRHLLVSHAHLIVYITVTVIVPPPNVTVTAPNTQIVGQPLTLTCNAVTVRGITSRATIVWRRNGAVRATRNNVLPSVDSSSQTYSDTFMIQSLSTDDNDIPYQCLLEVAMMNQSDQVTLSVTSKSVVVVVWFILNSLSE